MSFTVLSRSSFDVRLKELLLLLAAALFDAHRVANKAGFGWDTVRAANLKHFVRENIVFLGRLRGARG